MTGYIIYDAIIVFALFFGFFTWMLGWKKALIIMGTMFLMLGIAGGYFGFLF